MSKLQFRVLYREFLFRMVDLDLLSVQAQGDIHKLFGRFAALLLFFSAWLGLGGLFFAPGRMPLEARLAASWTAEHFLIATTMLAVGLFAVLSWESTFPDRRDVLVLAPLPVRARTLFLAKAAALATALGVAVVLLNAFTGLTWPPALAAKNVIRSWPAYWITMAAAGAFLMCSVLGVQGLAAQLPRRQYLRLSPFLQMGAFCLVLSVYFLEPAMVTPKFLSAPENRRLLGWLPSYWFLGLYQQLNGSMHPAMEPLARRAWAGLAIAVFTAGGAFLLSYFRTLRKIVEEPDIAPGAGGANWLPRFGKPFETAVMQFSIRTLLRSRQHRMILAFYLGVGFAIVIPLMKNALAHQQLLGQVNTPLLVSSIVMLCFWLVGTRVVFAMPLDLRANWIFRITAVRGVPECLRASRRALLALALVPAWAVSSALFLLLWPWRLAAAHLIVLALLGVILADLCLYGFQKIPFTCSYLPGKTHVNLAILAGVGLVYSIFFGAEMERRAIADGPGYLQMLAILAIVAGCARWRTAARARQEEAPRFEEELSGEVITLGLPRDGGYQAGLRANDGGQRVTPAR